MGLLAWLVLGLLAGWIASKVMGADDQLGIVGNLVIGVIGAFIGGWIAKLLGIGEDGIDLDLGSLILSVLGACLLLLLARRVARAY